MEVVRATDGALLDAFTAAVGFELLENRLSEAERLEMDYVGGEKGKLNGMESGDSHCQ